MRAPATEEGGFRQRVLSTAAGTEQGLVNSGCLHPRQALFQVLLPWPDVILASPEVIPADILMFQ